MTIRQWLEINDWAVNPTEPEGKFWRVHIGFINSKYREEDDTELTIRAYDLDELEELFDDFCVENNIANDTVVYVAVMETANNGEELNYFIF